jgi:exonuclease III
MRGFFWNIRGLGKIGKKQSLIDMIAENDVDFIGIQETKLENFAVSLLESLAGKKQFCWNWLSSKGAAGGF